jgi:xanthine dehydrogenase YagT iron-sulfur-binding subunit
MDGEANGSGNLTRRAFVETAAAVGVAATLEGAQAGGPEPAPNQIALQINGQTHTLLIEPRVTLLDALRERLHLTGTKKGCDHGQCGACTVLVNGRRINSCLTLAVMCEGEEITTIEGLAAGGNLHPVQAAFIRMDGFQCGYCTPGQICSVVALLSEWKAGAPSAATPDVAKQGPLELTDDEIRERMSGNLCRCGAYPNIVAAVREVAHQTARDTAGQTGGDR